MPLFSLIPAIAASPPALTGVGASPATTAVRRVCLAACVGMAALMSVQQAKAFGFDDVALKARQLAAKPHVATPDNLPAELKSLSYDQYRDIRFQPDRALWRAEKLPFEVMFFHLGKFQTQPVLINEVTKQGVKHVAFDRQDFDYGKNKLSQKAWGDLGFAGFRVHYALNSPDYKDELVVFLGASYFRALGKDQQYGLSARGLAIDTVGGQGEEFPRFVEFWIERPAADAKELVIHALMDSPRATGAYQITLRPGDNTAADVRTRLYLRAGVSTLGIAPLTSMFQHGENQPRKDDFRPEVHDSDGLMVATGEGEWLWRPLVNPRQPLVTSFATRDPKGFGLMQRDRAFASYEDLEARYERRPSAWITPKGAWGAGRVELFQWSTPDETNDNIVAYWVPEQLPAPGQPLDLAYEMQWQGKQMQRPPSGWTVQSRQGRGFEEVAPDEVQFVLDFDGPSIRGLSADAAVEAVVSAGPNGRVLARNAYRNDATGGWRLTLRVKRLDTQKPVELRAYLQHASNALTETWTSIIQPD
jgi:glucans biosynthesis protein